MTQKDSQHTQGDLLSIANNLIDLLRASQEHKAQAIKRGADEAELRALQAREAMLCESLHDLSRGLISESAASQSILDGNAMRFNASYAETINHVDNGIGSAKRWREGLTEKLYDSMESAMAKIEAAKHRPEFKSSMDFLDRMIARRDRIIEKMTDIRDHVVKALEVKTAKAGAIFNQYINLGADLLDISRVRAHDFFERGRTTALTSGAILADSACVTGVALWRLGLGLAKDTVLAVINTAAGVAIDAVEEANEYNSRVDDNRTIQVILDVTSGDDSSLWMLQHLIAPDRKLASGQSLADVVVQLSDDIEKLNNPHLMLKLGQILLDKGSKNEQLPAAIETMKQKIDLVNAEILEVQAREACAPTLGRRDAFPPTPMKDHIKKVQQRNI